jgi:lysophospholipase L1-like esterase
MLAREPVRPFRIVAFGSSSTEGSGATSAEASYPAQLARLLAARSAFPIEMINRGIGGQDIDDMMHRLRPDVVARHPDLVIWQAGSNDPLRGVPVDRFARELRRGIVDLQGAGAEVVLMEPQWCPQLEGDAAGLAFVEAVRAAGCDCGVDVVRRHDLMRRWVASHRIARQDLIGPDGLHMTDASYALLAQAVADQITERSRAYMRRAGQTVA